MSLQDPKWLTLGLIVLVLLALLAIFTSCARPYKAVKHPAMVWRTDGFEEK